MISEITAASSEQSAGINEVNQAIGSMDAVTQQNAALVEQAAAAAESMQQQAAALAQAVSVFKVEDTLRLSHRGRWPSRQLPSASSYKSPAADNCTTAPSSPGGRWIACCDRRSASPLRWRGTQRSCTPPSAAINDTTRARCFSNTFAPRAAPDSRH
jgi:type II secretory pathway pseudopilin PulG